MSPETLRRELPDLQRLVDAWQVGTLDDLSQQRLVDLLQSRRDVRQYFLEQCQIDAELRWRFGSQQQVAGTLASHEKGGNHPIAAIVLSGLGFRDDPGFPAVFDKVESCEPLAREWLQNYLTLRACVFLCLPRVAEANAAVSAICRELARLQLTNLTPEEFTQLACEVTCRLVGRQLQGRSRGSVSAVSKVVRRCLECRKEIDVVALYESFEAGVPRHVPADLLRLLGKRYLLEQTPEAIASTLNRPASVVRANLAQGRMLIWKSCEALTELGDMSHEPDVLLSLAFALDPKDSHQASKAGRRMPAESFLQELDQLTKDRANCRQLLVFAILHEALFRRLSLTHLLEVSKTRKDEEFHLVVTDMVRSLEQASVEVRPLADVKRPNPAWRTPIGWIAAVAAGLLIAATLGIWNGRPASDDPAPSPSVADADIPSKLPDAPGPIAPRIVVAEIKLVLEAVPAEGGAVKQGMPLYADDRLEFASGIVHLTTPAGSEWVLEGPVTVKFRENGEVYLVNGKLVGLNAGDDETLVVETPTLRVVDKGTEFGVSVAEDQTTSVAVYNGVVELSTARSGSSASTLRVEADYEATVDQGGELPSQSSRLTHDRTFIRPDEVALREEQRQGSVAAAERVAFFELLRVEGLLAYQGFHALSQGEQYTVGFLSPRSASPIQFGDDLVPGEGQWSSSGSLVLSNGGTMFLDLDVSERSRLAKRGLLDASQFVGGRQMELWICWKSRNFLDADRHFHWTGLSLMHGDNRQSQEPVFLGQPAGTSHLGLQIFNPDGEVIQHFDTDAKLPDDQMIVSDDRSHLWVARVTIEGEGHGSVAAWCDVDPARLDTANPHAEQHVAQLKFDRFRLEVSPEGDTGHCAYDEVFLTESLESLIAALERRGGKSGKAEGR